MERQPGSRTERPEKRPAYFGVVVRYGIVVLTGETSPTQNSARERCEQAIEKGSTHNKQLVGAKVEVRRLSSRFRYDAEGGGGGRG